MPTCKRCGADHPAEELVRHEREAMVLVHCPDCECLMGAYNERTH